MKKNKTLIKTCSAILIFCGLTFSPNVQGLSSNNTIVKNSYENKKEKDKEKDIINTDIIYKDRDNTNSGGGRGTSNNDGQHNNNSGYTQTNGNSTNNNGAGGGSTSIPLDGGLGILLLGAAAFGIKKLRDNRKQII